MKYFGKFAIRNLEEEGSEKEVTLEKSKVTKFDHLSEVVLSKRKTYWQPHSKNLASVYRCSHRMT